MGRVGGCITSLDMIISAEPFLEINFMRLRLVDKWFMDLGFGFVFKLRFHLRNPLLNLNLRVLALPDKVIESTHVLVPLIADG